MSGYRFYQFWQTIIVASDLKKSYFKIKGKKEERKQWKASQLMRDIFGNMIVLQLIRRG